MVFYLQLLWFLVNVAIFISTFIKYNGGQEFFYLRKLIGVSLPFARASAACLNLNCMIVLLPVCRNLISYLRGSCWYCKRNVRRQLDKSMSLHKASAYLICIQTGIHYFAHVFNFERFIHAWDTEGDSPGLRSALSSLPTLSNATWLNPIRKSGANPILELLVCVPGVTGVVITLALLVIVSSSMEVIRRSYFEVFWYTHHLFIVFYIALVTHGLGGLVRHQTNTEEHDPEYCQHHYQDWGHIPQCPDPQFAAGGAQTWKWVLVSILLYLTEIGIRLFRGQQYVKVIKVVQHPSRVIELQMHKPMFITRPGQYIFLQCPSISRLEWHPFTLTSAPHEDYFSVHIRIVGDWTSALSTACIAGQETRQFPRIAVDGPFGTASEDVPRYQAAILIGAGIGVTPFASILKDIWYQFSARPLEMKLKKIYFFWLCRDTHAFEWFGALLKQLEDTMTETNHPNFLEYHIHLTSGWSQSQALSIVSHEGEAEDVLTGLRQKTQYGRPNWEHVFRDVAQVHAGTRIGVFFCGPKSLSSTLHALSNEHSSDDLTSTQFVFNEENF
ncbi:hypothetical protein NP493_660g01059 [Ridgeia piscesae]|uniref:FAD-binding FR-type domain-containing protein n=1 Tax=Ridgeia piscesae TaxID=27915 RepID=A0AAD9NQ44_RIDPI|nr:hypothetical protein NP493_660g01059 [Ridgeia piscesae]